MTTLYIALALFLFLNLIAGLWRLLQGPSSEDRMLTVQLFGTITVMILILLAQIDGYSALIDVALLFASLSSITVIAFIQSGDRRES